MSPPRIRIGRIGIDNLTFEEALSAIVELSRVRGGVVFTPNVDHIVRAEKDEEFREAYECAALSVVDGMPVLWASRVLGAPLPVKISGADLFEPLMDRAAKEDLSVYLLGGRKGAATMTQEKLLARNPTLRFAGIGPITREIVEDPALLDDVERELRVRRPNIVIVALGSPLQETWSAKVAPGLPPGVFLGLGSALDVYSGLVPRAPVQMQRAGLEWAFRVAHDPRRLWHRYASAAPCFASIIGKQLAAGKRGRD